MDFKEEENFTNFNQEDPPTYKIDQSTAIIEIVDFAVNLSNIDLNNFSDFYIQKIRLLIHLIVNDSISYADLMALDELWNTILQTFFETDNQQISDCIAQYMIEVLNKYIKFRKFCRQKNIPDFILEKIKSKSASLQDVILLGRCINWESNFQELQERFYNFYLPIEYYEDLIVHFASYAKAHVHALDDCLNMINFGFENNVFNGFITALYILSDPPADSTAMIHSATHCLLQNISEINHDQYKFIAKITASAYKFTYAAQCLKKFYESEIIFNLCINDSNFFPLLCLIYPEPQTFYKIHGSEIESFLFSKVENGTSYEREQASAAVAAALRLFSGDELTDFFHSSLFENLSISIEGCNENSCKICVGLRSMLTEHPECADHLGSLIEILEEIEDDEGVGPSAYLLLNMIIDRN